MKSLYKIIILTILAGVIGVAGVFLFKDAPDQTVTKRIVRNQPLHTEQVVKQKSSNHTIKATPLSIKAGELLGYNFTFKGEGWVNTNAIPGAAGQGAAIDLISSSDGTIQFFIYDEGPNHWTLGSKIQLDTLTLNNVPEDYAEDIEIPFVVTLNKNGSFSDFILAKHISGQAEKYIQQLVSQFQFVRPNKYRDNWKAKEKDSVGSAIVNYENDMKSNRLPVIKKSKERYFGVNSLGDSVPARVEILASSAEAELSNINGWIKDIDSNEALQIFIENKHLSHMDSSFSASSTDNFPSFLFPNELKEFKKIVFVSGLKSSDKLKTNPYIDQMTQGMNIDELLSSYRSIQSMGDSNMSEQLVINYLRKNSQVSDELVSLLDRTDNGMAREEELFMWYALAKAGATENQVAMLKAAQNQQLAESTRMRALAAIHEVGVPSDDLINGLWGLTQDQNNEIAEMSTLALGSMAKPDHASIDSNPSLIVQQLASYLNQKDLPPSKQVNILDALFNASNPESLPSVKHHFNNANSEVRAALFESVSAIDSNTAREEFFQQYSQETEPKVKQHALASIARNIDNPSVNNWVKEQLLASKNGQINDMIFESALNAIGGSLDSHPENIEFLQKLASADNLSLSLKAKVYKYVSPAQQ